MQNSVISNWITTLYVSQPSSVVFSDFWTRITSLCGSQNSPVIFCMQNSVPSIRNTSLHGSQLSRVVFWCKTATYGPEKQVSMGPRHDLSFGGCKTAWLASEILVSMGRSPHVCFLDGKQRLLDQNNKSLRVADKSCRFVQGNSNFSPWITSLYVSQPSSVVFACKTEHFGPEFQVSMGPSPHLRFLYTKQRVLAQNYKSLWVPDLTCPFVQSKRPDLYQNIKSILVPAHFSGFCLQNSVISIRITSLHGSQPSRVVFGYKTATFGPE